MFKRQRGCSAKAAFSLFLSERLAVGALIHGRVGLMGADGDVVQRAVITAAAVVGAILNIAADRVVCIIQIHGYPFLSALKVAA